ncbi:hypothetical protein NEHOM01_0911 [Nematocida homosporus]|uniref:uncharacterized protein n=1 Tax=Nematocida homosporus TaxID=1912981 RepID=UPI002220C7C5|nr:uncharacterized protein NEHOM01_0911 [Nematocida homosporus]KAI5185552.1 hypothetical protein NEHOM01_0911 [Nematocida homosporus]
MKIDRVLLLPLIVFTSLVCSIVGSQNYIYVHKIIDIYEHVSDMAKFYRITTIEAKLYYPNVKVHNNLPTSVVMLVEMQKGKTGLQGVNEVKQRVSSLIDGMQGRVGEVDIIIFDWCVAPFITPTVKLPPNTGSKLSSTVKAYVCNMFNERFSEAKIPHGGSFALLMHPPVGPTPAINKWKEDDQDDEEEGVTLIYNDIKNGFYGPFSAIFKQVEQDNRQNKATDNGNFVSNLLHQAQSWFARTDLNNQKD